MIDTGLSAEQKYQRIRGLMTDVVETLGLDLNDDSLAETPQPWYFHHHGGSQHPHRRNHVSNGNISHHLHETRIKENAQRNQDEIPALNSPTPTSMAVYGFRLNTNIRPSNRMRVSETDRRQHRMGCAHIQKNLHARGQALDQK